MWGLGGTRYYFSEGRTKKYGYLGGTDLVFFLLFLFHQAVLEGKEHFYKDRFLMQFCHFLIGAMNNQEVGALLGTQFYEESK